MVRANVKSALFGFVALVFSASMPSVVSANGQRFIDVIKSETFINGENPKDKNFCSYSVTEKYFGQNCGGDGTAEVRWKRYGAYNNGIALIYQDGSKLDYFVYMYLNQNGDIVQVSAHRWKDNRTFRTRLFPNTKKPNATTQSINYFQTVFAQGKSVATAQDLYKFIHEHRRFFLGAPLNGADLPMVIPPLAGIDPRLLPAGWVDSPLAKPVTGTASTTIAKADGPVFAARQSFRDCPECPEMIVVPAGKFLMGSGSGEVGRDGNEGPVHMVTFARPFALGKYEVTFDEWDACVAAGKCSNPSSKLLDWARGKRPVSGVSYMDVQYYIAWLREKTGADYFLPSESEWEYAARAGTTTPWNTGEAILTDDANILDQFKQPVPVGGFPPNAFGLHDMHGNVAEWVLDCLDVGYFGVPTDGGAAIKAGCSNQVARGGWFGQKPVDVRSAVRQYGGQQAPLSKVGFRVARAVNALSK